MFFSIRRIAFLCFIISGAASISYQTIWLRQAMTYFGVITPISSAVLSVFMLGLALGTFLSGRITNIISPRLALIFYAMVEALIGGLAFTVPYFFKKGYLFLLDSGQMQSGSYLLYSCLFITIILLPVCTLIGSTFPFLMRCIQNNEKEDRIFSFLYYANLCGALIGCVLPGVSIELYGFQYTLQITVALNIIVAILALCALPDFAITESATIDSPDKVGSGRIPFSVILILFAFGFVTLGCEVVWIKSFIFALGSTVYSFAIILAVYLICTAFGTKMYRENLNNISLYYTIITWLPIFALLPIMATSFVVLQCFPQLVVLSIAPLCFCFGYLTPKIIDNACGNNTRNISLAYMYNCLGCIAGPVFTTYILFPVAGIKESLIAYAFMLLPISYFMLRDVNIHRIKALALFILILFTSFYMPNYEDHIKSNGMLTRDHIGYIGALGKNLDKILTVNGVGMTTLNNVTKNMAHLPLLHHPDAKSALVICFGMGTTVRSLTAWPLDSITAVELSKGVLKSFSYFYSDAERVLTDPRVHIVNDDGRRFLNRSGDTYDIIILDPPPPIEAAGSGLLYTTEFLTAVKLRLAPGGILQQWIPDNRPTVFVNAALNAIYKQFKYVKLYDAIEKNTGIHILASDVPLPELTKAQFIKNLPPKAAKDIEEWLPDQSLEEIAAASLHSIDKKDVLRPELKDIYMSDDRLYNEFYLLRAYNLISTFRN